MHLILILCILSSRSTLKSENDAQLRAFMKEEESAEIPAAVQKVALVSPSSNDSLMGYTGGLGRNFCSSKHSLVPNWEACVNWMVSVIVCYRNAYCAGLWSLAVSTLPLKSQTSLYT